MMPVSEAELDAARQWIGENPYGEGVQHVENALDALKFSEYLRTLEDSRRHAQARRGAVAEVLLLVFLAICLLLGGFFAGLAIANDPNPEPLLFSTVSDKRVELLPLAPDTGALMKKAVTA